MYFVYILRCVDSSLYCGYTTDLTHSLKAHSGAVPGGAKYTRLHRPVSVEAVWTTERKGAALSLEALIKNLARADKERLIGTDDFSSVFGEKADGSEFTRDRSCEGALAEE